MATEEANVNADNEDADQFSKNFLGSSTLEELCRAIRTEQAEETVNVIDLEGVLNKKDDDSEVKVNIVTFKRAERKIDVLKNLQCIDVSTTAGAGAATAAGGTLTPVGGPGKEFQVWVKDKMTPVQIFGKKL
jgi:hypothetical protein